MTATKPIKASLGGNIHPDGPVPGYDKISYVWLDLGDGTTLQVFYNRETRLLVADIACDGGGNEFVRTTVPTLSRRFRADCARQLAEEAS